MSYFVNVITPLPLEKPLTYKLSDKQADLLEIGMRLIVPIRNRFYTALVIKIHRDPPAKYEAKDVEELLDLKPVVQLSQLKHWYWISKYYMCTLSEVYKAAMPSAMLLESETLISLPKEEVSEEGLSDREYLIIEALKQQPTLKISEVMQLLGIKQVMPLIHSMVSKQLLIVEEYIEHRYKPKFETYYFLDFDLDNKAEFESHLQGLKGAKRQQELFLFLCQLKASQENPVASIKLRKNFENYSSFVRSLIAKGVVNSIKRQVDRIQFDSKKQLEPLKELNEEQNKAYHSLKSHMENQKVSLLKGVTSSGKTEVYAKLIEEQLATEKQVLYLVPEIALTVQLIKRLQSYFGKSLAVFHSKYNNQERVEVWNQVLQGSDKAQLILGARSSLLLPFKNLGLIIVDEEHESSYKQYDPAPRYHARDVAVYLGSSQKIPVILGSATPSIESRYNVDKGKYELVELNKRFEDVLMPEIQLIDLKKHYKKKEVKNHFSYPLLEAIDDTIKERKQVILFQNRRGYAPLVECERCGHTPGCPHCDVSLTYHQHSKQLRCHYCGFQEAYQASCQSCGSVELNTKGLGTEQIVDALKELRPDLAVERLDYDTTRGKNAYDEIITAFELGQIDVLVGTQMVAKGLDFEKVGLVGVLNADTLLNFPEYNAHERAFQMLTQVAGRAGRKKDRGKVLIQSYNPYHEILKLVSTNDYDGMYKEQLYQREIYKYPPSNKIIKITFKHKEYNRINQAAQWYVNGLKKGLSNLSILGPEFPAVARVKNNYIKHIVIKVPHTIPPSEIKTYLQRLRTSFYSIAQYRSIRINFDVDYL